MAQDSETGMVWSLADRLGSIDVLVNEQGVIVDQRTYDSFGNTLNQLDPTVKFRFGYTGRESDPETGLYYYRARYFDANVGRFISTDPIGFEAGDANLYRYVNNSSTLATDPSGKILNILGGAAILGFAGGVIGGLYALADDIQSGHLNENTFERVINGAKTGAIAGAVIGSGLAIVGGLAGLAVTAKLVSASTVTATGLLAGAGFSRWQVGGGIYNIANGKPLTGTLDIIGGVLRIKALQPGYKHYQGQVDAERLVRLDKIGANINSLSEETRATISSIEESITNRVKPSLTEPFEVNASEYNLSKGSPLTNDLARQAGIPEYIDLSKPNNVVGLSYEDLMQHYQLRSFEVSPQGCSKGSGLTQVFQLKNHPNLKEVRYSPGGGSHGLSPYHKFTYNDKTEVKIVHNLSE